MDTMDKIIAEIVKIQPMITPSSDIYYLDILAMNKDIEFRKKIKRCLELGENSGLDKNNGKS